MSSDAEVATQHGSADGLPLENLLDSTVMSSRLRDPSPSNEEISEKEDQFAKAMISARVFAIPHLIKILHSNISLSFVDEPPAFIV